MRLYLDKSQNLVTVYTTQPKILVTYIQVHFYLNYQRYIGPFVMELWLITFFKYFLDSYYDVYKRRQHKNGSPSFKIAFYFFIYLPKISFKWTAIQSNNSFFFDERTWTFGIHKFYISKTADESESLLMSTVVLSIFNLSFVSVDWLLLMNYLLLLLLQINSIVSKILTNLLKCFYT